MSKTLDELHEIRKQLDTETANMSDEAYADYINSLAEVGIEQIRKFTHSEGREITEEQNGMVISRPKTVQSK